MEVCGGCGMGGGYVVTIGSVVVGGVENSWVEKERDMEREEEKIIIMKEYLNEMIKKIEVLM